jgi:plastocyanin
MIESFDSRALRFNDCYGQRFMREGTYHYNILPVLGHYISEERPFKINVISRTSEARMHQHSILITTNQRGFQVSQAELEIEAGDLVLWNCPEATSTPYGIVGNKPFFASHRLVNESGYSHAFASAGEYYWMDAYGSQASGVIRVSDPECKDEADFQRWRQLLSKGTLVMIDHDQVNPKEVEIVTGQTVFFAIMKGPGISITDRVLLAEKPTESQAKS